MVWRVLPRLSVLVHEIHSGSLPHLVLLAPEIQLHGILAGQVKSLVSHTFRHWLVLCFGSVSGCGYRDAYLSFFNHFFFNFYFKITMDSQKSFRDRTESCHIPFIQLSSPNISMLHNTIRFLIFFFFCSLSLSSWLLALKNSGSMNSLRHSNQKFWARNLPVD